MNDFPPPELRVVLANGAVYHFTQGFTIGRHSTCALCVNDAVVSRRHAEVLQDGGKWWIRDLDSANGVFIDGQRIERAALSGAVRIQLGEAGPQLFFEAASPVTLPPAAQTPEHRAPVTAEAEPVSSNRPELERFKDHYFGKQLDPTAGEHTMMVRRAYAEVQKKQRLIYGLVIGLAGVLLIVVGSLAWYNHNQLVEQRKLAADIFYTMRTLEIDLIKLQVEAARQKSLQAKKQLDAVRARQKRLEQSYDRYVDSLDVYTKGMSAEKKLILRMARRFGECEINMPDGFVKAVSKYIKNWQSSRRLSRVIRRARRKGYIRKIVQDLTAEDLPPQLLYLAVQESNLDRRAVGPRTRFGIAKGMWQFIPATAEKYGLRLGPLKDEPVVDPLDDRYNFQKSTRAAAKYLRDIYTTDAQASGLLVIASYNWGERRVVKLIRTLPKNPRERNFWKLITTYRKEVPPQTYDYVLSIFSAAVIGENPHLFGFDFDDPLS